MCEKSIENVIFHYNYYNIAMIEYLIGRIVMIKLYKKSKDNKLF